MQDGDLVLGAEALQRCLQAKRLVQRRAHKLLDHGLPEWSQGMSIEAAAESFRTGKADSFDLARLVVEHLHSGRAEQVNDLLLLATLDIVVSQDGNDWTPAGCQALGQHLSLALQPSAREITRQDEDVGLGADLAEELVPRVAILLMHVDIRESCHPDGATGVLRIRHL
jgi:hypothetical protein